MTELDALVAAVVADPLNDFLREVVAEYLEEYADGRRDWLDRAAFIRLQLELARETRKTYKPKIQRKINDLMKGVVPLRAWPWLNEYLDDWGMGLCVDGWKYAVASGPPSSILLCSVSFRRGFVREMYAPAEWLCKPGQARLVGSRCPLEMLRVVLPPAFPGDIRGAVRVEFVPPGEDHGWQAYLYDGMSFRRNVDYYSMEGGAETLAGLLEQVVARPEFGPAPMTAVTQEGRL